MAAQPKALSDRNLRLSKIAIPHARNATWTVEKKIEVVTTYLVLGNLRQVAAATGVSYGMVKQWRIQPWWKEVEAEIVASRRVAQGSKLAKIVDKSLDVIDDRLTNGDLVLNNKTGKLIRKDVSLRDATTAANALMQRAAIIEKMQLDDKVVETQISIKDQLASLAAEFAKMNNRGKADAEPIEYKESNAVHEEGPQDGEISSGLREGSGSLHEQAFSGEETGRAEQGSEADGEGW